jgi:hypothetical protein
MVKITETITEAFDGSHRVDREANAIRGVKLIGFESKNNRSYSPDALKSAVTLYEGAKVNLDHITQPGRQRSVTERIGVMKNATYVEGKGVFADFHYNPKHSAIEAFLWDAENNPASTGFSHHAVLQLGPRKDNKDVVESIVAVKSVDLVADPATTSGIFEGVEGVIADAIMADEKRRALYQICDKAISLIRAQLWDEKIKFDAAKAAINTIAADLIAELLKTSETASESEPDVSAQLATLQEQLAAAQSKLREQNLAAAIEAELSAAGLSIADKAAVPDFLRTLLLSTESVDARAAIIADRKALLTTVPTGKVPTGAKPVTTVTENVTLSPELFVKRLRGVA